MVHTKRPRSTNPIKWFEPPNYVQDSPEKRGEFLLQLFLWHGVNQPPGVIQNEVSHSIRVGHRVGEREKPSETVTQQHKPLQTHSLSPPLQSRHKHSLHGLWVLGEGDASGAGKAWQVQSKQSPIRVQVVQILVELDDTTAKAMDEDERSFLREGWLLRFHHQTSDHCTLSYWNIQVPVL